MLRIAIVDDHPLIRAGLRQYLSAHVDLRVVAECACASEAMDVVQQELADVMLLDISMPGVSGVDALQSIRARAPQLPVLILSSFPAAHYALKLLRQGAWGYLSKDCEPEDIVRAIRTVGLGRRYTTPGVAERTADPMSLPALRAEHELLSEREFQVFLRLAKGETPGGIADSMALSVKTISTFRARVMKKMGLVSNSDLTYYALKNGLIE